MKKVTEKQLDVFKKMHQDKKLTKSLDYNMLTRYYKVIDKSGEILSASVNPLLAAQHLNESADLWEVTL